jgi:hypothetical protein
MDRPGEDRLWQRLEAQYAAAVAKANYTPQAKQCEVCGLTRQCRQRPTGLITSPLAWMCDDCWNHANETA